ncbi:MAG: MgtC/SapB family protein [Candidatus Verstraetearchaeota archaeon]|nr:MgtC/SapB family protein [Candidatus Verstraetearchaeota archaeon]
MDWITAVLRLVLTFVLSLLFGVYRQKAFKPAGFGIYVFVAIAACGISITALEQMRDGAVPLLSAVVTATGFLGAGALLKTGYKVIGFVTAASIWLFACFGVIMAMGEYAVAGAVYAMVLVSQALDRFMEREGIGTQTKVTICTSNTVDLKEIDGEISECARNFKLEGIEEDKEKGRMVMSYTIYGKKGCVPALASRLRGKEWFQSLRAE